MSNKKCSVCGTPISWRSKRKKFCSDKCKSKFYYKNSYSSQQKRGKDRKLKLIKLAGGKCIRCGYSNNSSSLCFHHRNPNEKEMALDLRILSNTKMDKILEEFKKCDLLCNNCHGEIHNPDSKLI